MFSWVANKRKIIAIKPGHKNNTKFAKIKKIMKEQKDKMHPWLILINPHYTINKK